MSTGRPKDELLEKPLGRLQKSAAPQQDKQARRQAGKKPNAAAADSAGGAGPAAAEASPFVGLHAGPSETHPVLDAGVVTNEEAWRHGRLLRVGGTQYQVVLNPPFLARMEVHAAAFVGIPLMLVVQVGAAAQEGRGAGKGCVQAAGWACACVWQNASLIRTPAGCMAPLLTLRNLPSASHPPTPAAAFRRGGGLPVGVVPPAARQRRVGAHPRRHLPALHASARGRRLPPAGGVHAGAAQQRTRGGGRAGGRRLCRLRTSGGAAGAGGGGTAARTDAAADGGA